jgi:hypothetical protein
MSEQNRASQNGAVPCTVSRRSSKRRDFEHSRQSSPEIVEQGTHSDLLVNREMYYALYLTGFQE